jgi:hypothetical protein
VTRRAGHATWVALVPALVLAAAGWAAEAARVVEERGRWESGYGAEFYNVVGRVENTSGHALRWVKLRVEALDAGGKVVASTVTYNESAEGLTVPGAKPADLRVTPLAAGAAERFRASFLKDETPPFTSHRVVVVEAPAVAP